MNCGSQSPADRYFNTAQVGTVVNKDGGTGAYASIYIPFYGRFFASGAQFDYSGGTIPQDKSRTFGGRNIPGNSGKGFNCCN